MQIQLPELSLTMLESAHELPLYPSHLQNIDRQRMPIVILYNGRDHFVPSMIMSVAEYNQWKLEILPKLSSASLEIPEDVDHQYVSPKLSVHLNTLQDNLKTTVTMCSGTAAPAVVAAVAIRKSHGPLFGQVTVTSPASPGSSIPSVKHPSPSLRSAKKRRKKPPKEYTCDKCGTVKTRKSDLDDQLSVEHQIGSPRKCPFCNKHFPSKRIFKQHQRTQHIGRYKCDQSGCEFGTDTKGLLTTHKVRHHQQQKARRFRCKTCRKEFDGHNVLMKHIKRNMCHVLKNLSCNQCRVTRWFKTPEGRERHVKVYHSEDIPKLKCARCGNNYGSMSPMINHMAWHKSLDILARAKRNRLAKEAALKQKGQQDAECGQRVGVSQSAPAKIIRAASLKFPPRPTRKAAAEKKGKK